MKFKINNYELELTYSFRIMVYYEQISGHSLDPKNFNTNDLITLFYSAVISSLQKERRPIISMIDFLDAIDDNGGEKCLMNFSDWYESIIKAQYELLTSTSDNIEGKEGEDKKKTN